MQDEPRMGLADAGDLMPEKVESLFFHHVKKLMQILTFTEVLLTRFLRISILSINILRNIF